MVPDEEIDDKRKYVDFLPVYDLQAAATSFREQTTPSIIRWKPVKAKKLNNGMFIAQVVGKSMQPTIPDRSFCLFRFQRGGSCNGLVILAESHLVSDPVTQQNFTIKRYKSEKEYFPDGRWRHKRIILSPDDEAFKDIILQNVNDDDFRVVAEFMEII